MKFYVMKAILFIFLSIFVSGCISPFGNLKFHEFVESYNSHEKIDEDWIKEFNSRLEKEQSKYKPRGQDNDALPITIKKRDDGNLEYNYSYAAGFYERYYNFYEIVNKETKEVIAWNFKYCDKNTINIYDEKSYIKCIRQTRVTYQGNNIYRVGISRDFREKYGYGYYEVSKSQDSLGMLEEALDNENVCKNGIRHIIGKMFFGAGGERFYVECNE